MAQSTVFDFTHASGTPVTAVDAKRLRAVSLGGPGGQGEGQVTLFSEGFVVSSGDLPFVDAQARYTLWRDRMDLYA